MCIFQHIIYLSQFYKPVVLKVKKPRAIGAGPALILPYGFFDGGVASGFGGAGFCLFLNEFHSLEFALGAGNCTNTKADLIALWALLHVTQSMGIP